MSTPRTIRAYDHGQECPRCMQDANAMHAEAPSKGQGLWILTQAGVFTRFGVMVLGRIYDWQHRKDQGAS